VCVILKCRSSPLDQRANEICALYWDFTQRRFVLSYRHFGETCRSLLQGSRIPRRILASFLECYMSLTSRRNHEVTQKTHCLFLHEKLYEFNFVYFGNTLRGYNSEILYAFTMPIEATCFVCVIVRDLINLIIIIIM
jgi:hypothetical protein